MKTWMFLVGAGVASAWMIMSMRNRASSMLGLSGNSAAGASNMQSSAVQRQGDMDTHTSADKDVRKYTKESATGNVD